MKKDTSSVKIVKDLIIKFSESKEWDIASQEWEVISHEYSEGKCVCHKTLHSVFKVRNIINGEILYPIGEDCVMIFNNERMKKSVADYIKVYCDECALTFSNKYVLNTHLASIKHKKNTGSRACMGCSKRIRANYPPMYMFCKACCIKNNKKYKDAVALFKDTVKI